MQEFCGWRVKSIKDALEKLERPVRTKSLRVANPLPEGVTPQVPDVANVLEGKEETG